MFAVDMGSGQGLIALKDLRRTFFIPPGSHDDLLIERAASGLRYLPDIKPGDAIPNELLDGTASWTVARRHKQIARDKIQVQLLSWMSGSPMSYANHDDLKKILQNEEHKRSLKAAFGRAAVALGLEESQSEKVLDRIESLARELCYIEALRERCQDVFKIHGHLDALTKTYNNDPRVSAEIASMKQQMVKAANELNDVLDGIDAEASDVLGALMSIDDVIQAVRRARDDLHHILMEWDPVIIRWQNLEMVKSQPIDRALAATYQFLAQRFSTAKSIIKRRDQ
jgi:hypothetical protein